MQRGRLSRSIPGSARIPAGSKHGAEEIAATIRQAPNAPG